ncbi:MAG: hypothetical protein WC178_05150 [Candidatus Paceibacterota bacterium]
MFITILAILITVIPFFLLSCVEIEESEKRERNRRARARTEKIKAIEARWPFVTIPEIYFYKKNTDPGFTEPFTERTLCKLRIKHNKELKRCLKRS